MKHLSILGSTGSIGTSVLDIVRMHPDLFCVKALTCANNIELLAKQIEEFKPEMVAVFDDQKAFDLSKTVKGNCKPEILIGQAGFNEAAAYQS